MRDEFKTVLAVCGVLATIAVHGIALTRNLSRTESAVEQCKIQAAYNSGRIEKLIEALHGLHVRLAILEQRGRR